MSAPYKPPAFNRKAFNCPFCSAYASMVWGDCFANFPRLGSVGIGYRAAQCSHCHRFSIWVVSSNQAGQLVYPQLLASPVPSPDMPPECLKDYEEARRVLPESVRAAAALLRLAVQKLCKELGQKGENLNDDIGNLVKNGLDQRIQQALDIVRVTGNNAVHPGEMNLEDSPEVVEELFKLVNMIVDEMITKPRELADLYKKLPEGAREAVAKRDGVSAKQAGS